jgi:hypothetical protein
MDDYLLTFELSPEKDQLHICADETGLDFFIDQLNRLRKSIVNDKSDHIHLMTEEWGGYELSSEPQIGTLLNHVKIICWKQEESPTATNL